LADGYVHLGEVFLRRGDQPSAIEWFERGRQAQPSSVWPYYGLGEANLASGDPATAAGDLEVMVGRRPDIAAGWSLLSVAYTRLGRLDEAARAERAAA